MPQPHAIVDKYELLRPIGSGGMSTVWLAKHTRLGSLHALKFLQVDSEGTRTRLMREGQAMASLRHPNVVSVTDVIEHAGQPVLVMEYVEGSSLDAWVGPGRLSIEQVDHLAKQVLAGVAVAHSRGLMHRDLKPANVLVESVDGQLVAKVADFGLVGSTAARKTSRLTGHLHAMGTPGYMAPEQYTSPQDVDLRADVFALGCVLYELLTGEYAFEAPTAEALLDVVMSPVRPDPATLVPDAPARMLDAIRVALIADREHRPDDAGTLRRIWMGELAAGRGAEATLGTLAPGVSDLSSPHDEPAPSAAARTTPLPAPAAAPTPPPAPAAAPTPQPAPAPATPDPGLGARRIGAHWVVEGALGEGGVGEVFRCRHDQTGQLAAVKVLRPPHPSLADKLKVRARRCAETLAQLDHPNIVRVHGWEDDGDGGALIMDLVDGRPLDPALFRTDDGGLDGARLRSMFDRILDAIAYAHEAQVAHRDLKWSNVLVRTVDGEPLVLDWGSVYVEVEGQARLTRFDDSMALGRTDVYAPPEAILNPIGADPYRWDIYSLGVMLHLALTGLDEAYPTAMSTDDIVALKSSAPLDPGPGFPDRLRDLVRSATATMPKRRPKSARAFGLLLQDAIDDLRRVSTPVGGTMFLDDDPGRHTAITNVPTPQRETPDPVRTALPVTPAPAPATPAPDPVAAPPRVAPVVWVGGAVGVVGLLALAVAVGVVLSGAPSSPVVPDVPPTVDADASVAGSPAAAAVDPASGGEVAPTQAGEPPAPTPSVVSAAPSAPSTPSPSTPSPSTPSPSTRAASTTPAPAKPPPSAAPEDDDAVAAVEPPAPTPAPTPAAALATRLGEYGSRSADALLARAIAEPAFATQLVTDLSQTPPDQASLQAAKRTYTGLLREMERMPATGARFVRAAAQGGALDAFVRISRHGSAGDFKLPVLKTIAEEAPSNVRAPSTAKDCRSLAEFVDLIGRASVVAGQPWIVEACNACTGITGAVVGKCGEIDAP